VGDPKPIRVLGAHGVVSRSAGTTRPDEDAADDESDDSGRHPGSISGHDALRSEGDIETLKEPDGTCDDEDDSDCEANLAHPVNLALDIAGRSGE
jgi:hypothetical protein